MNAEITKVGSFRIVRDRREAAAKQPSWYVEGPDGSTDYQWSRLGAIGAACKRWPALAEAVDRARARF